MIWLNVMDNLAQTGATLFHRHHLFSTKNMIAHGKKGYAAFTLNINGELSVFNHKCTKDGIAHSSMNAGAPVISAGELMIHNGRLISINTFSGHYEPSLYSQLRILDHFSRRGIDLSATTILTQQNPEHVLNQHLGSMKSASNWTRQQYATPALALIKPFREQVKLQMKAFKCQADRKLKTTASHKPSKTVFTLPQVRRQNLYWHESGSVFSVQKKNKPIYCKT